MKTAFAATRRSLFMMEPERLIIIGLDTKDGPDHPLYDARILLPLNEATVLDIAERGVIEPIVVKKDGEDAIVTDGRRRVMHAREVNRRIKAAGGTEFIKIPVLPPEKGTDGALIGLMVALNQHREEDTAINIANKIAKYLRTGRTEAEAAVTFNMSESSLKNTLSLLDLVPELQAKIADGTLGVTRGYALAKLAQKDQIAAFDKPKAAPAKKGPSRAALLKLIDAGKGKLSAEFVLGLRYALGETTDEENHGIAASVAGKVA